MSLQEITERELSANGVVSMPTRPNASREFGGRSYSPTQLKEAFDRLPRLLAERYNELVRQMESGDLAEDMKVPFGEGAKPLADYLAESEARLALLEEHLRHYIETGRLTVETDGTSTEAVNAAYVTQTANALWQEVRLALDGLRLSLDGGTLSLESTEGNPISAVETPLVEMDARLAMCESILAQTTVTETEVEDTFSTRQTASGMEVIDGAKTEVKLVKGSTAAVDGALVHAEFRGVRSENAEGTKTDVFETPAPVTLGFADVLNLTEGKIYRGTTSVINSWEAPRVDSHTINGAVWVQLYFSDAVIWKKVVGNCPMRSQYIDGNNTVGALGQNATLVMCNKVHPANLIRIILGTLEEVRGNSEEGYATVEEARAYLKKHNVIFCYERSAETVVEEEVPISQKEYTAYNGGTETVEGNGQPVTITQTYLTPRGGNQ